LSLILGQTCDGSVMSDQNCQHVWMELPWILVILRRTIGENFSNIYSFTVLEMLENAGKK